MQQRNLQKATFKLSASMAVPLSPSVVVFIILFFLQIPSSSFAEKLRFPLWVLAEAYPGAEQSFDPAREPYSHAVKNVQKLAPFILEGMVYGWKFSYTPSDKLRGVKEHFSFEPLIAMTLDDPNLMFSEARLSDSKLTCWVDYVLDPATLQRQKSWKSVTNKKTSGSGSASVSLEIEGVKQAYAQALLHGIRNYARTITKNKPKEIAGALLLTGDPIMVVDAGKYVVTLDLLLKIDLIIDYKVF